MDNPLTFLDTPFPRINISILIIIEISFHFSISDIISMMRSGENGERSEWRSEVGI